MDGSTKENQFYLDMKLFNSELRILCISILSLRDTVDNLKKLLIISLINSLEIYCMIQNKK